MCPVTCQSNDGGYDHVKMAKIQTNPNWKFVGGRLCLDFINTVGGRVGSATVLREKLASYPDLLEWSRAAGIATPAEVHVLARLAQSHPHQARSALRRVILLRESLYRIFVSAVDARRPGAADLATLGRELQLARSRQRLSHDRGSFRWTWEQSESALDRVLWPIALSAAELLTSGDLSRLRQCEGNDCGWMFLDTSRNRSRHWCDMKDCGNRAKVMRFRRRQKRSRSRTASS